MTKTLLLLALPLALVACAEPRLTPAPGEHPGWPQPSPPGRVPTPFSDSYAPHSGTTIASPPADANGNIPYAVRGQTNTPVLQTPTPSAPAAEPHPGTQ